MEFFIYYNVLAIIKNAFFFLVLKLLFDEYKNEIPTETGFHF
ncbi:hypothetical protein [Mycoplasmopsis gallinarum]|nr:hypothetical protein [Mycoplasmopsis gallinarum]